MAVGIDTGPHYISDEQLLAWLAVRQENLYADLSDALDLSQERHEVVSELTEIKQHLTESRRAKNFEAVDVELQAFLARYGEDPAYADICDEVRKIAEPINKNWGIPDVTPDPVVTYRKEYSGRWYTVVKEVKPWEPPRSCFDDKTIDTWRATIDGKIDGTNQNDQLGMVHVQQLKSNVDQSAQMASALIAGSDRTIGAILSNLA